MLENNYFKVQNEFRDELYKLSGSAVKVYLILRSCINEGKDNKAFPGYEYIREKTGLSTASIRKAIIELVKAGWIENIHVRFNSSTEYFLPDAKIELPNQELIKEVEEKRKSGRKEFSNSKNELQQSKNQITVIQKIETNNTYLTRPIEQYLLTEDSKTETSEGKPPSSSLVDNSSSLKEDKDNPVSSIFKEEYDSGLLSKEEDKSSSNPSRIDTQDVDTSLVSIEDDKNFREVIKMNTKQGIFKFYRDDPNFDNYLVLGCKVELEPVAIGV